MTVLFRYVASQILKIIGTVLLVVVGIYLVVDFFEKIDNFFEAGLPLARALTFFLFKSPFIIAQILPVAILLSVIIVLGVMGKNNELTALSSCGVGMHHLLKPVLAVGFGTGIFLFLFSETVVPLSALKANEIWNREVKGDSAVVSREKNIWFKTPDRIVHISFYEPEKQTIRGVTLYRFDKSFRMTERIDAEIGVHENGSWRLTDLLVQILDIDTDEYEVQFPVEMSVSLDISPESLARAAKKSEEMSILSLLAYIRSIEAEGYDAVKYRVDFHAKTALPFSCIILTLIAFGITIKRRMKENPAFPILLGIITAFSYWVFFSLCMSMGYGERIPPWIAAWTADVVFTGIALFMLRGLNQ